MSRNSGSNMRFSGGIAAACLWTALAAHASPLPHLADFEAVGSGTLRYFGLRIYDATLWSPGGVWTAGQPFALELRYARSFDGAAIARRSIEEIRAQRPYPDATLARWEAQMRDLPRRSGRRPPHRCAHAWRGRRFLPRHQQTRPDRR